MRQAWRGVLLLLLPPPLRFVAISSSWWLLGCTPAVTAAATVAAAAAGVPTGHAILEIVEPEPNAVWTTPSVPLRVRVLGSRDLEEEQVVCVSVTWAQVRGGAACGPRLLPPAGSEPCSMVGQGSQSFCEASIQDWSLSGLETGRYRVFVRVRERRT